MKINQMPAITWGRLDVNDAVIDDIEFNEILHPAETVPAGVDAEDHEEGRRYNFHTSQEAPLRLDIAIENQSNTKIDIAVEEGMSAFVIESISSASEGTGLVETSYSVAANASLKFVQIVRTGKDAKAVNRINGNVAQDAKVSIIQIFTDSKANYTELKSDLDGNRAEFTADIGYIVDTDDLLDMNYVITHKGKSSVCLLTIDGVLYEGASKTFRGTIDLKHGCAGAKGTENENVLLIGDTMINKTVPVILCDEEDVEGNHGATIGKLDEDLVFYLESRGIDRDSIDRIMADARIRRVASLIGDEETVKTILDEEQE